MTQEHPITPPPELVEQWMPEEPEHAYAEDYELGVFDARLDARNHLLSIAAELEAHPD